MSCPLVKNMTELKETSSLFVIVECPKCHNRTTSLYFNAELILKYNCFICNPNLVPLVGVMRG